jgi:moderate conductance mechanosensitive channel
MDWNWVENIDWASLATKSSIILVKLIAIIILFFIVKAIGNRIIRRSFEKMENRKNISPGRVKTLQTLSISAFSYTIFFIFLVFVFGIFDFDVKGLIAGAGIVGLAIGFGAQGLVSDVVTGFFLLLERQLDVGDYVTTAGFNGVVEEVGLRTTHIRSMDGTLHYIPNRQITILSNHSRGNMQALVDIGISYSDDIDHAVSVIQDVCEKIVSDDERIVEGPNVLGVQTLGPSEVVIRVIAKTKNGEQWGVERQLKKAIKEAFDQHGIEIPFPHQVLVEKKKN